MYCTLSGVWHYCLHLYFNFTICVPFLGDCIRYVAFIWSCYHLSRIARPTLYICVGFVPLTSNCILNIPYLSVTLMFVPSPTSPLSFSSSSDGSVDHQDNVSSPSHPSQSGISPVLDRSRPNYHGQNPLIPNPLLLRRPQTRSGKSL